MVTQTARIEVQIKPRASRNSVEGWQEETLVIRISVPPVEGAANKALVKMLAGKAGIAKGRVRIVSGEKSRTKILEFEGITLEDLKERLR
jgi:uncharacterized protein (TIGR00251 family)